jgi:membrane-bound lytic murein transglycosylase B
MFARYLENRWMRVLGLASTAAACLLVAAGPPATAAHEDFGSWLGELATEAREKGISQSAIDAALTGVQPIPAILELDRRQPKAPQQFCGYMARRLTDTRIERGRRMLKEHRGLLQQISAEYGVPPRFVIALWGLESNFGDYLGDYPVIDALATLAHDDRRAPLFRKQLLAALRIVDEGHQTPGHMKGSWAGAMGQVQFMPTTFLSYAVDYDGDGRKDVWNNLADAFASAASYLRREGWRTGETWGREVRLPAELSGAGKELQKPRSLESWSQAGVQRIDGGSLPASDMRGSIRLPSQDAADAFLVYANFHTLLRWNHSTFFGISVGALADELSHTASLRACRS